MANGYSTSMSGMGITETAIVPQGVMNVIRVNETTPNLQLIQSFPVVSRNGNIHIHQDPFTGQMYEMTDEFHSMIPQIIGGNSSVMTGGVMPITITNSSDVNFVSDSIENYSVVNTTEDTSNLSDILSYQIYASESGFTFYKDPSLNVIYAVSDNLKNKSLEILQTRGSGLQNVIPDRITQSDVLNEILITPTFTNQTDLQNNISPQRLPSTIANQSTSRYVYPIFTNRTTIDRVSNSVVDRSSGNRFTYPSSR